MVRTKPEALYIPGKEGLFILIKLKQTIKSSPILKPQDLWSFQEADLIWSYLVPTEQFLAPLSLTLEILYPSAHFPRSLPSPFTDIILMLATFPGTSMLGLTV